MLRRVALQWASVPRSELHVLVAAMPATFVVALDLPSNAIPYTSTFAWLRALVAHALRKDAHLLFAPGPQSLRWTYREFAHAIGNLILAILVNARDGRVLKLGRSLSAGSPLMLSLERALADRSGIYIVRDQESLALLRLSRVSAAPDVAIADHILRSAPPSQPRRYLALSFREDREVSIQAVLSLADQARSRGWEPILVTQVARDDKFHDQLSQILDCKVVNWPSARAHKDQLLRVLAAYDLSHAVVSNRLHSLVFGIARGAAPVALTSEHDTKISRTFRTLHIDDPTLWPGQPLPEPVTNYKCNEQVIWYARQRLMKVASEVEKALLMRYDYPSVDESRNASDGEL